MPPCTPKASPSQRQKRHFRKPETANFLHSFKLEPHEWICLRACKIFAAVPAGDGGGIGSLRASGFSKKKSDFGLEGGGAFALMSKRAERGEKFATPPGAVVAGFSARSSRGEAPLQFRPPSGEMAAGLLIQIGRTRKNSIPRKPAENHPHRRRQAALRGRFSH